MEEAFNKAFSKHRVLPFFLYEYFGTVVLCFTVNWMRDPSGRALYSILLMVSIWAWDRSSSHFNFAITLGEIVYNFDTLKEAWPRYFLTTLAQFLGSLTAILFNY